MCTKLDSFRTYWGNACDIAKYNFFYARGFNCAPPGYKWLTLKQVLAFATHNNVAVKKYTRTAFLVLIHKCVSGLCNSDCSLRTDNALNSQEPAVRDGTERTCVKYRTAAEIIYSWWSAITYLGDVSSTGHSKLTHLRSINNSRVKTMKM